MRSCSLLAIRGEWLPERRSDIERRVAAHGQSEQGRHENTGKSTKARESISTGPGRRATGRASCIGPGFTVDAVNNSLKRELPKKAEKFKTRTCVPGRDPLRIRAEWAVQFSAFFGLFSRTV